MPDTCGVFMVLLKIMIFLSDLRFLYFNYFGCPYDPHEKHKIEPKNLLSCHCHTQNYP